MSLLAALLLSWGQPTPDDFITGYTTYYAPDLMQLVADNRHMELDRFVGGVALNRAGDLGRVVWLEIDGEMAGPFLSVDCSQKIHYQDRIDSGYIVEVPAWFAQEYGFYKVGPYPITVHFRRQEYGTGIPY